MPRTSSSRSRIIGHGGTWTLRRRHGRRDAIDAMFAARRERDVDLTTRHHEIQSTSSTSYAADIVFAISFADKVSADDAQALVQVLEQIPGIFKVRYSEPSSFACWYADESDVSGEASEEDTAKTCASSSVETRKTELHALLTAVLRAFLNDQIVAPNDRRDWEPSIYGLA